MDYKQKYKEALEIIKGNLGALNEIAETGAEVVNIQSIKNCFYRAFPEIKESVDEKIRKALFEYFKKRKDEGDMDETWYGIPYDDILAWLENQKKLNWSTEDEHIAKDTIYFLENAKKHYASTIAIDSCIDWLETLKLKMKN